MRALRRFWKRSTSWTTAGHDEERLRAEIEGHIALQTDENLRAGLSPLEARRQAALKFGGVETMRESYREQKGLPFIESLFRDVRFTLRRLRRAPTFTAATVLTLALGTGATTSIFTLVHAVLLRSLPVGKPEELYRLGQENRCCYLAGYSQDKEFSLVSYELYQYLRDHTPGSSELAAFPSPQLGFGVRRAGVAEAAQLYPGEFVSGNYFAMFGINAYAGRTLTPQDDRPSAAPVAVMSYRLWRERYGADPSVIGGVFNVNDEPFTVVGIAPPGFFGDTLRSTPPDFFLPLTSERYVKSDSDLDKYDTHWLQLIGRIRSGGNPASVEAAMRVALKQWLRSHWNEMSPSDRTKYPEQTLYLTPGGSGIATMRDRYEHWLQILMAISGFVLLIVCANVANLMLVRGMEHRRQTSLAIALGARTGRLVREPLLESLCLSLLGGAAGLAIAFEGTRLILRFAFPTIAGLAGIPISAAPSTPVLLFTFAISFVTGLAFGIAPAWMASRVDPAETLRTGAHSTPLTGSLPRKALVVLQASLSLVLLSAAGLLTAALQDLENQNFGFEQDRRLVVSIDPRLAGYRTPQLPLLYERLHDSVASIPGVSAAALCLYSPLGGGGWGSGVWVDGHPPPGPRDDYFAGWERVTAGYFEVIGTPIVKGRGISAEDTATSRKVAVISEAFARKFFPHEDPIGKHFGRSADASHEFEVVGVVKDARYRNANLDQRPDAFFFQAVAQADYTQTNMGSLFLRDTVIVTRPGTGVSATQIQQAVAAVNPNLPVISIRTMREQVSGQFTQQRLIARLTSFFGLLSLVLASIGLYGVTAYNAGRRVNEVGVRMALGASRGDVVRLIVRGAFVLIAFGLLLGLPLTFAAGRFLGSQLYGMSPYNPMVMLAATGSLGVSALAAALIPALRASRISPIEALRVE